jgi:hypothetical protein
MAHLFRGSPLVLIVVGMWIGVCNADERAAVSLPREEVQGSTSVGVASAAASAAATENERAIWAMLKEVADRNIDMAKHDVDVVEWIFSVFAAVTAIVGIAGGGFGWYQLNAARKTLLEFATQESERLSDLRVDLQAIMELQSLLDGNYSSICGDRAKLLELRKKSEKDGKLAANQAKTAQAAIDALEAARAAGADKTRVAMADKAANAAAAKAERLRKAAEEAERSADRARDPLILSAKNMFNDLSRVEVLARKLNSPRWKAWYHGWMGFVHMVMDQFDSAINHFNAAVDLLKKESRTGNEDRMVAHRYNLACCFALKASPDQSKRDGRNTLDRMITELKYVAKHEPWRVARAAEDPDFVHVLTDARFRAIVRESEGI